VIGGRVPTNAGGAAQPLVEVRLAGVLIKKILTEDADFLLANRWAEWRGTGNRRYLQLTDSAPLSSFETVTLGRRGDGTTRMRADGTCRNHAAGQRMGHDGSREFLPTIELIKT
jgi:hypothetical protein